MIRVRNFSAILLLLLSPLAACGGEPTTADDVVAQPQSARVFSDEDKRAARALSIGNNSALATAGTPYFQALLCSGAVESIAVRLRDAGSLSEEQLRGFEQVKALYDQRVRTFAAQEGKSVADIRADLQQQEESVALEGGGRVRVAVACLQRLQEAE